MVIPEINPEHAGVIPAQRRRLGTERGFIAVKSNCSLQSYVPAIHPLHAILGVTDVLACTYQAISGAGKTFATWPEMVDNVNPFIGGRRREERAGAIEDLGPLSKMARSCNGNTGSTSHPSACGCRCPMDIWPRCSSRCRQEAHHGGDHCSAWQSYQGLPQELGLPSAPQAVPALFYRARTGPRPSWTGNWKSGMAVSMGRLRPDTQYDYKFVCLSHNTLRGSCRRRCAVGGAALRPKLYLI